MKKQKIGRLIVSFGLGFFVACMVGALVAYVPPDGGELTRELSQIGVGGVFIAICGWAIMTG